MEQAPILGAQSHVQFPYISLMSRFLSEKSRRVKVRVFQKGSGHKTLPHISLTNIPYLPAVHSVWQGDVGVWMGRSQLSTRPSGKIPMTYPPPFSDICPTWTELKHGSKNGSIELQICSVLGRGKSLHGRVLTSTLVTRMSTQVFSSTPLCVAR